MNSYRILLELLSKETGISLFDKVDITFEENYKRPDRQRVWVDIGGYSYQVHRAQIKGGIYVMKVHISTMGAPLFGHNIPMDTPIDRMYYKVHRTHEDFGVTVTIKPNAYKMCGGGGWYSWVDIYEYKGKQYVKFN